jgi:hypothetical protein
MTELAPPGSQWVPRDQTIRECVEALRGEAARQADRYYAPIYFGRCADFLERTMLGD